MQKERSDWVEMRPSLDPARLVFIDETGIRTNCTPRYGWSKRGEPCIGKAPCSWKSYSTVAAIRLSGVGEATTVEGAFNKPLFKEYMESALLPSLTRGDVVIMDNLSVHKNSFDERKFKRRGIAIKYLPRYSPDLNPIEEMWANVKRIIRKIEPRSGDEIWWAMNEALWSVTSENIAGWFRGCGYFH